MTEAPNSFALEFFVMIGKCRYFADDDFKSYIIVSSVVMRERKKRR